MTIAIAKASTKLNENQQFLLGAISSDLDESDGGKRNLGKIKNRIERIVFLTTPPPLKPAPAAPPATTPQAAPPQAATPTTPTPAPTPAAPRRRPNEAPKYKLDSIKSKTWFADTKNISKTDNTGQEVYTFKVNSPLTLGDVTQHLRTTDGKFKTIWVKKGNKPAYEAKFNTATKQYHWTGYKNKNLANRVKFNAGTQIAETKDAFPNTPAAAPSAPASSPSENKNRLIEVQKAKEEMTKELKMRSKFNITHIEFEEDNTLNDEFYADMKTALQKQRPPYALTIKSITLKDKDNNTKVIKKNQIEGSDDGRYALLYEGDTFDNVGKWLTAKPRKKSAVMNKLIGSGDAALDVITEKFLKGTLAPPAAAAEVAKWLKAPEKVISVNDFDNIKNQKLKAALNALKKANIKVKSGEFHEHGGSQVKLQIENNGGGTKITAQANETLPQFIARLSKLPAALKSLNKLKQETNVDNSQSNLGDGESNPIAITLQDIPHFMPIIRDGKISLKKFHENGALEQLNSMPALVNRFKNVMTFLDTEPKAKLTAAADKISDFKSLEKFVKKMEIVKAAYEAVSEIKDTEIVKDALAITMKANDDFIFDLQVKKGSKTWAIAQANVDSANNIIFAKSAATTTTAATATAAPESKDAGGLKKFFEKKLNPHAT